MIFYTGYSFLLLLAAALLVLCGLFFLFVTQVVSRKINCA